MNAQEQKLPNVKLLNSALFSFFRQSSLLPPQLRVVVVLCQDSRFIDEGGLMINNRTVLTLTEAKEQQKFNFRETVSRPQLSATPCLRSPVSSLHLLLGGEDQGRSHDI